MRILQRLALKFVPTGLNWKATSFRSSQKISCWFSHYSKMFRFLFTRNIKFPRWKYVILSQSHVIVQKPSEVNPPNPDLCQFCGWNKLPWRFTYRCFHGTFTAFRNRHSVYLQHWRKDDQNNTKQSHFSLHLDALSLWMYWVYFSNCFSL